MLATMQFAPQELRTYFVTSVTGQRRHLFRVEKNANLLIDVMQRHRTQSRFALHAFVVMPDHIHLILTPSPSVSLEKAMQFIKGGFSFDLKRKLDVWLPGSNKSQIRTAEKFDACKFYIEQNPVRKGLVEQADMYPSPLRRCLSSLMNARRGCITMIS